MQADSFKVWCLLYDDELEKIWQSEKESLKSVSMLLHVFNKELNAVQSQFNGKYTAVKEKLLKASENCDERRQEIQCDSDDDKENIIPATQFDKVDLNAVQPLFENFSLNTNTETADYLQPVVEMSPVIFSKNKLITKRKISPIKCKPQVREKSEFSESINSSMDTTSIIDKTIEVPSKKSPRKSFRKSKNSVFEYSAGKRKQTELSIVKTKIAKKQTETPLLGITDMLSLINREDTQNQTASCDKIITIDSDDSSSDSNDKTSSIPVVSLNFLNNYDKLSAKKTGPNYVYEGETVRGKERSKLKGWPCQDCAKYYKGLKLPPEEMQKRLNLCSRHRGKFKPPEETFRSFWDLTIPTPPNQIE